ncbi:hypothetical protein SAMN05421806_101656 [Streptomyces indicus]|uniref:Uncharacterized protein n=1 Tax=Streptomyces indicus TaxID=417292 RepID=A0A1G8U5N0_9ACTN|nr:hypothetical protein SAMN05421806_101656 [Streptomyces indicus]
MWSPGGLYGVCLLIAADGRIPCDARANPPKRQATLHERSASLTEMTHQVFIPGVAAGEGV